MKLNKVLIIAYCGSLLKANVSIGIEESDKNGHVKPMTRRLTSPPQPSAIPSTNLKTRRASVSSPSRTSPRKEVPASSESEIIRGLNEKVKTLESQVETSWNKEYKHTEEKVALFNERKTLLELVELQEKMLEEAKVDKETLKVQEQLIKALEFAIVKLKVTYDAKQAEVDALKEKLSNYEKPGH